MRRTLRAPSKELPAILEECAGHLEEFLGLVHCRYVCPSSRLIANDIRRSSLLVEMLVKSVLVSYEISISIGSESGLWRNVEDSCCGE
jgi:hypothetical protein